MQGLVAWGTVAKGSRRPFQPLGSQDQMARIQQLQATSRQAHGMTKRRDLCRSTDWLNGNWHSAAEIANFN